ncbi:hypothetical protein ACHAXA_007718 [Cyclostephanos tholiformis]|uniref:Uncharacterized protein n=1 Tax=Cyclostephanos tholiformis TaxID=382380 RepID=A0ABD3RY70_9STRA
MPKNTKKNYAWSAFQSSPDPSTLPDIGGLFGGDAKMIEKEKNDREENNSEDDSGGDDEEKAAASPLYAGVSAGEAFLRQLTSQQAHGKNDDVGDAKVNKTFRTMESVELEMLSPLKKETEKNNEAMTGKSLDDNPMDSGEAALKSEIARQAKFQFPDPIMELMNPSGDPGGFGMPPMHHQQYHPQMPYHPPLHHSPNHQYPPMQQQYPGYPYPHQPPPNPYYHHPYAMPPNNIPPGFTTLQVRVPNILGPGNTMIVHGMHIAVPEGIPSGAIIPVMLPIHPPLGRHHNPTSHHPEHYVDYYYHHQHYFAQHHHQPQQMMGGYNSNQQSQQPQSQQPQSQQQQSQQHPQAHIPHPHPHSWAFKVAATVTPSKSIPDTVSQPVVTTPLADVASASLSTGTIGTNADVIHVPVISKAKREGTLVEAVGVTATSEVAAGGGGIVNKSKNEGVASSSKRSGKKKQHQKDASGGNSEGNKDGTVAKKKSGKK